MFLGIDVSKNTLDVALLGANAKPQHKVFANDATGHIQLQAWLQAQGVASVHACLEATGTWAEPALGLRKRRSRSTKPVIASASSIPHRSMPSAEVGSSAPRPTKPMPFSSPAFARCTSQLYGRRFHQKCSSYKDLCDVWSTGIGAPGLEHREGMLTMEENRLAWGGICAPGQEDLEEHVADLQARLEKTRRQIKDHIDQNPDLKQQAKLLESIPGTGKHSWHRCYHSGFIDGRMG